MIDSTSQSTLVDRASPWGRPIPCLIAGLARSDVLSVVGSIARQVPTDHHLRVKYILRPRFIP